MCNKTGHEHIPSGCAFGNMFMTFGEIYSHIPIFPCHKCIDTKFSVVLCTSKIIGHQKCCQIADHKMADCVEVIGSMAVIVIIIVLSSLFPCSAGVGLGLFPQLSAFTL